MGKKGLQVTFQGNPNLKNINPAFKGTPVDEEGRFFNLEFPFKVHLKDVFRWKFQSNPYRQAKLEDTFKLTNRTDTTYLKRSEDCIVWLGHATFFLRLEGIVFLIDPVFYSIPFVKRFNNHALLPDQLLIIDYLLISHDHRDHCDEKSIRELCLRFPNLKILTGLNMEGLLKSWSNNCELQMAGWYQQYETDNKVKVTFLPTRHWSKRGINDDNSRLWGAFVFQFSSFTIYFGGDSGYSDHYLHAQKLFPSIDIAMLGCGAFMPEWFMAPNHSSPEGAVRAFNELGAKCLVPMHYGTFDLSDEPPGEPYRRMKKLDTEGKIHGKLNLLDPGEPLYFK